MNIALQGELPTAFQEIRGMVNKCTWCVKVFVTSTDGNWEDCGTGMLGFYSKDLVTGEFQPVNPHSYPDPSTDPASSEAKSRDELYITVTKKSDKLGHNNSITADEEILSKLRGNAPESDYILYASMEHSYDFDRQEKNIISWHQ